MCIRVLISINYANNDAVRLVGNHLIPNLNLISSQVSHSSIVKLKFRRSSGGRKTRLFAKGLRQKAARPYKCEGCIDPDHTEKYSQSEAAVENNLLCLFADHDPPIDREQEKSVRQMPGCRQNADYVDHHNPRYLKFAGDDRVSFVGVAGDRDQIES